MTKDIGELFGRAVANFRAEQSRQQPVKERVLTELERDFEAVKGQVRKLKPHVETHPSVNFFWIFTDQITIEFRTGPNRPAVQLIVRLYHPGNHGFKKRDVRLSAMRLRDAVGRRERSGGIPRHPMR